MSYYEIKEKSSDHFLGKWYLGDFLKDIKIDIFKENQINGNIGALKKLESHIKSDNIVVLNTGAVPFFNINEVFRYHINNKNDLTIITNKKIKDFKDSHYSYCFIIKKEILKKIPLNKYYDFKIHLLNNISGLKIGNYVVKNKLLPLVSFQDYINLIKYVIKHNPLPFFKISEDYIIVKKKFLALHKRSYVKTKNIKNAIIGKNTIVEDHVVIDNSVIDDNVKIENNCYIAQSYIHSGDTINKSSMIIRNNIVKSIKSIITKKYFEEELWESFLDYFLLFASIPIVIPLMLLISLLILIFDGWPVFFTQERMGKDKKPFKMIKFRTMKIGSENNKTKLNEKNEVDGPMFKISNDPRITKLGKFLRVTSLDELPQLFNILKGEMSFVGPRPLSANEMSWHPQWRDLRVKVKPGLTGLWQIKKSKNETFSEWITYDTEYIINKNPVLYLKIIFLTFFHVFQKKNK